jgi:hypothetical protein
MVYYVVSVLGRDFTCVVYISNAVFDYIPSDWTVGFNGVTLTRNARPWELDMSSVQMNVLVLEHVDHADTDTDESGDSSPGTSVGSEAGVWDVGDEV